MILLVGTGLWLTFSLRALQFSHLIHAFTLIVRKTPDRKAQGDISNFEALMVALSATVGTGNIAGVATAIYIGGPGALFWMWMTGLVGMATKYAEAVLAVKYRVQNENGTFSGGPMYYICLLYTSSPAWRYSGDCSRWCWSPCSSPTGRHRCRTGP